MICIFSRRCLTNSSKLVCRRDKVAHFLVLALTIVFSHELNYKTKGRKIIRKQNLFVVLESKQNTTTEKHTNVRQFLPNNLNNVTKTDGSPAWL